MMRVFNELRKIRKHDVRKEKTKIRSDRQKSLVGKNKSTPW